MQRTQVWPPGRTQALTTPVPGYPVPCSGLLRYLRYLLEIHYRTLGLMMSMAHSPPFPVLPLSPSVRKLRVLTLEVALRCGDGVGHLSPSLMPTTHY